MEYQTIYTIKESEKATVELVAIDKYEGPVILKRLRGVKPDIYRLLCCVQNPHIPQIFECEQNEDELFVLEEYVDGENLEDYLEKNRPGDKEILELALQLCEAVECLHYMETPIIHRDIKPANIIITEAGVLKLIDFDISRQYKENADSGDTRLLGTKEFASPEQFGYSQTDVRSDIYSMGVVFKGMEELTSKRVSNRWNKMVRKCTNFNPDDRYQNVRHIKRRIQRMLLGLRMPRVTTVGWICTLVILGIVLWQNGLLMKQNRELMSNGVTNTPEPVMTSTSVPSPSPEPVFSLTPSAGPTFSPSPEPTASLTPTEEPSPTPSPKPTATFTPTPEATTTPTPEATTTPTPEPTPTFTPTPSSSPTPTPSPEPTKKLTPTPTVVPDSLEDKVLRLFASTAYTLQSQSVPESVSNYYYKSASEDTELILNWTTYMIDLIPWGGVAYNYETKEITYIPDKMVESGEGFVRIKDEFVNSLEPGMYHVKAYIGKDAGTCSAAAMDVEIHAENEVIVKEENAILQNNDSFYSDYQKDATAIINPASCVRFKELYFESQVAGTELEPECYDIICDGKVVLIKKEYLAQYLGETSIDIVFVFDDGTSGRMSIYYYNGLPNSSRIEVSLTPTPSPKPTPTPSTIPAPASGQVSVGKAIPTIAPTLTPAATPTVEEMEKEAFRLTEEHRAELDANQQINVKYHYYKGKNEADTLVINFNSNYIVNEELWGGLCYNYNTKEAVYIPVEMYEEGNGYVVVKNEFMDKLEPAEYVLYTCYARVGAKHSYSPAYVEVHSEDEIMVQETQIFIETYPKYYWDYPRDIAGIVLPNASCRIIGLYLKSGQSETMLEPVDSIWYDIVCDGKVIVIKKEYLAQYFDNGYIMFVISCDDGRAGSLEIEYLSGLPQSVVSEYLKRMPYLLITPSPTPN